MEHYSLGLDIGTDSVGWALVDENNDVIKKNGKHLWGVRMFDEASSAQNRRTFRNSRRRLNRRRQRIVLLQKIFFDEINKKDKTFFERLDDSFFKIEDKRNKNVNTLFCDKNYTDRDYKKEYPTIYHLRDALIKTDEPKDIRFIYLAFHHMIKYRGNFLKEGEEFEPSDISLIENFFAELNEELENRALALDEDNMAHDNYYQTIDTSKENFYTDLQNILLAKKGKKETKEDLIHLFGCNKKTFVQEAIAPLLSGSSVNLAKLTIVKEENHKKTEIDLSKEEYLANIEAACQNIPELSSLISLFEGVKMVRDHYELVSILGNHKFLSEAMKEIYESHNKDLAELKKLIKNYLPEDYNYCFRRRTQTVIKKGKEHIEPINNYVNYIGFNDYRGKKERFGKIRQEDFYKFIKAELDKIKADEAQETIRNILDKIDKQTYMRKQNSASNGCFPMQLNLMEMDAIIKKQSEHYPFLSEEKDKILSILKFKLPYYVGPLNTSSKYSWVIKKTQDKIYPWNLDKVVDLDETAQKFIRRMQRKCTYLHGENDYCLPQESMIYSAYKCFSYLNKIYVNYKPIQISTKEKVFKDVFLKEKKPTKKSITVAIKAIEGTKEIAITHTEGKELEEVNCNMKSYILFSNLFGEKFEENKEMIEDIISDITLFEDKSILEKRLREKYHLDEAKIKEIKGYNFKDYGRLSKQLLVGFELTNNSTGEVFSNVIELMEKTTLNLQEILYNTEYNLMAEIDKYNKSVNADEATNDFKSYIDNYLYLSPIAKRSLIQSYEIIEELEKIIKHPIERYYVECTRTNQAKKNRVDSRYDKLKKLYTEVKNDADSFNVDMNKLKKQLDDNKDNLRSDKLYFYFTQLGKCMYSLKPIDLDKLISSNDTYDIDHIFPQSLIKDDSLSNRVLTEKSINNNRKSDKFLFETDILEPKCYKFYDMLLKKELISKEKYRRLTLKEISKNELDGFVNRQLVSTNQSVKGLIEVLKACKVNNTADIIYSKAEVVSDFRKDFDLPKSRLANNFHHAHDAYLNVVCGRVVDQYFKAHNYRDIKDYYHLKDQKITTNPQTIFKYDRYVNGSPLWKKEETIAKIKHYLYETFDVFETTRAYIGNELYSKVTIQPAGKGSYPVKVKENDPRKDTEKYGGFSDPSYTFYCVIKCKKKKNQIEYHYVSIPALYKNNIDAYLESKNYKDYEIVLNNLKINTVFKVGKLKFCVTGNTKGSYYIKNLLDRRFDYHSIVTIKKIEKYFDMVKRGNYLKREEDKIILSPARNEKCKEIALENQELEKLYQTIKTMFSKEIYSFSNIVNICGKLPECLNHLNIDDKVYTLNELLRLLKTNERGTADLTTINMSSTCGTLLFNGTIQPGTQIIAESVTGYYTKVLFEVK